MQRGPGADRPPVEQNSAGVGVINAIDGISNLGNTGANKSEEADNLARPNGHIDIVVFAPSAQACQFQATSTKSSHKQRM